VTRAILLGMLRSLLVLDLLSESPEIDDVAHNDSRPPLPRLSPRRVASKVHDDSSHHAFLARTKTAASSSQCRRSCLPTNAQYVERNTIQRHIFVIYTMIPAPARELA
jgi:hypothetical protein